MKKKKLWKRKFSRNENGISSFIFMIWYFYLKINVASLSLIIISPTAWCGFSLDDHISSIPGAAPGRSQSSSRLPPSSREVSPALLTMTLAQFYSLTLCSVTVSTVNSWQVQGKLTPDLRAQPAKPSSFPPSVRSYPAEQQTK